MIIYGQSSDIFRPTLVFDQINLLYIINGEVNKFTIRMGRYSILSLKGNTQLEKWRQWFEMFSIASRLSEKSERVQVATLL